MKTSGIGMGIGDWGLGISRATGIALTVALLAPASLIAQNPADPTMRPRPAPRPRALSPTCRPCEPG